MSMLYGTCHNYGEEGRGVKFYPYKNGGGGGRGGKGFSYPGLGGTTGFGVVLARGTSVEGGGGARTVKPSWREGAQKNIWTHKFPILYPHSLRPRNI